MPRIESLNKDQLDALQETGNIGCSYAATAVSNMIGKNVNISVPELKVEETQNLDNIFNNIFGIENKIVGVYLELTDEFQGSILMLFTKKSALSLSDTLIGQEPGTSTELNEMTKSAITEVGNIVVSAYTNALGALLNSTVMLSPPTFTEEVPQGVLDKLQTTLGGDTKHALIFDIKFTGEDNLFDSYFVLLPSPKSLDNLLNKLCCMVPEDGEPNTDNYLNSLKNGD